MQHHRIFPASVAALIAGHRSSLPGSHTTSTAAGYSTEVTDGRCYDRSRKALKLGVLGAMLALSLSLSGGAFAAGKPVLVVVGASPGGDTDRLARGIAKEMAPLLGQPVIVENKPGAGGNIAAQYVADSAKDGNTLLVSYSSFSVNPSLYKHLPFDPEKDFSPISMLAETPAVLVARKDFPANTVADVIRLAKAAPGKYSFAIGGVGSSVHMATASFEMQAGIKGLNVPFNGTTPALEAVLGGQVDLMFDTTSNVMPFLNSGRLKYLGMTSEQPMPQFPGVPPIGATLKNFSSKAWFGMFAPAGVPRARIEQLNRAVVAGAQHESFKKLIVPEGGIVVTMTPGELSRFVAADIKHYAKIVKFTGATPQ